MMGAFRTFLFLVLVTGVVFGNGRFGRKHGGKQAFKFLRGIGNPSIRSASENVGLWPSVFNLATKALIMANATCGERGREEFCRMTENGKGKCGVCDNFSPDPGKRHPIHYAIDGSSRWWQSPPLFSGPEYEYVTITLDLKQTYQVAYVIIKAANSPRPGSWILERSLDGESFYPWQFFASSDRECKEKYGLPARKGKPHYTTDTEVICTSFFSSLKPMENGEIHVSLIHGRPGANETNPELMEFTKARYVRLRFQGFRGAVEPLPKWLSQDISRDKKRLFYSIRDISIGGQCVCNGHAADCRHNVASGHPECECVHHTCGPNCGTCCPLFNQRLWAPGTARDANKCLPCNCHGHAISCHYDEAVDRAGLSLDVEGNYQGGGVCDNCTAYTTGINCEQCIPGYYRLPGIPPDADFPCTKCDCDPIGSTGTCTQEGHAAGTCHCKPGYAGEKCELCAPGYRGFPNCELCPCDPRGTLDSGGDCEGDCVCKANVEGKFCDRCKSGHFALRSDDSEGCSPCYCSGVTTLCESAFLITKKIDTLDDWLITDIKVATIEKPSLDERGKLTLGNYELVGIHFYYWLAPKEYIGNKLESYGSFLNFHVRWVVMRGDTSGKPTKGPSVVMIGHNGMRIAYGDDLFKQQTNMTFNVRLEEKGWYHVPSDVKDIVTRLRRAEYKGDPVTRSQFLSVLLNIKYILLRATFHTDQIECSLETVTMGSGELEQNESYSPVEKCSCPSGYSGLSCESCSYGYIRLDVNTTNHESQGFCLKCDCNGHSEVCNADTGECFCEHNTIGEKCERCAPGYYGNPLRGTATDCKKCACPLLEDENNFSPSCQLDYSSEELENEEDEGYVCTQCPKGYTGDHCEICDNGYFGDPIVLGETCKPCDCNGGPCDSNTGQCLACKGNTEGFKCERCKPGYFGNPITANCQPCLCDHLGSLSKECDNVTGQCFCKERFTGLTCDKCETGYGNVTAFCTPCECNLIGSKSEICDPHTGMCDCRPGVEGFHCDACQHLHYGFSEVGCQSCKCYSKGSEIPTCDIVTGQCRCKLNYVGLQCDNCKPGYWDHPTQGCIKCTCDSTGAINDQCNKLGQCNCLPGIGGTRCDRCLDGYYGFCNRGCKPCQPCNKEGHICDQNTGACVCPPLKEGTSCQDCIKDTWLLPNKTCVACECSTTGSVKSQCNRKTGICTCKLGYEGEKCDRCSYGYYGYPHCRRCSCNPAGTIKSACDSLGICHCYSNGQCPCKENVSGKRCNSCKTNTFGLDIENHEGCTKCFCFGRSEHCSESGYTWDEERGNDLLTFSNTAIQNNLLSNDVSVQKDIRVHAYPYSTLYWKLPPNFSGDLILSYGGYLKYSSSSFRSEYDDSPDVLIYGKNTTLISRYSTDDKIKLHEDFWLEENTAITREKLMIVLQNVTKILIKANANVTLSNVSLDVAREISGKPPPRALSVEKCECPKEYDGTSCQNPNAGYFRYFPKPTDNNVTWIDLAIGKAKPCECNGLSDTCDRETGFCLNCTDNRGGLHCENCAEGYYLDMDSKCKPCQCPSTEKKFASSCFVRKASFVCACKKGYTGPDCRECSRGYYGNPLEEHGECKPCNCNIDGSISDICDYITGQCICIEGFTGKQCSQCVASRHVIQNHRCSPCDNCTQLLLDELDEMYFNLSSNTPHLQNGVTPPWSKLHEFERKFISTNTSVEKYKYKTDIAKEIIDEAKVEFFEKKLPRLNSTIHQNQRELEDVLKEGDQLLRDSNASLEKLDNTKERILEIIDILNNFGNSHETTKNALAKGRKLLKEIKGIRSKFKTEYDYRKIISHCEKVSKTADNISTLLVSPDDLKEKLRDFNTRLADLKEISLKTDVVNAKVEALNDRNRERINNLSRIIESLDLYGFVDGVNNDIKEIKEMNNKINALLNKTQHNYDLLNANEEYKKLIEFLEEKEKMLREQNPIVEDYLEKVKEHVRHLQQNVTEYEKILNFTNEEWKKTIDTYRQLESDVNLAKQAALDAKAQLEEAYAIIKPIGSDSIHDKASLMYADSTRLLARVENNRNLPSTREYPIKIATAWLDLQSNGKMNNDQTARLRQMANSHNIVDLYNVIQETISVSAQMQKVYQNVTNINYTKHYDLSRDYIKLLNLTTNDKISELKNKISYAHGHLRHIFEQSDTTFEAIKRFNTKTDVGGPRYQTIEHKLADLKAKIQRAREAADSIKVSLSGSSCSMKYALGHLEPSIYSTLKVHINNLTDYDTERSIFFIHNSHRKQFVELKIANSSVILKWQLGTEPRSLTIHINRKEEVEPISMERVGRHVQLKVGSVVKKEKGNGDPSFLYLTPNDIIEVGKESGLPGCLSDIYWNGQRIGFWNFKEKQGDCQGCVRLYSSSNYLTFFDGSGYSFIINQPGDMNPKQISFSFDINTLDEDALLILIPQPKEVAEEKRCTTFMAVSLKNGHVQAEVHYSDSEPLILTTKEKYNTGKRRHIEITKHYDRNTLRETLKLNNEQISKENVPSNAILRIKKISYIYFGGIPPQYTLNSSVNTCLPQHTSDGLYGSMESISGSSGVTISLTKGFYYGLKSPENEIDYRRAWFSGDGFIKFKPQDVQSVSFVLRTNQTDGFIMSVKDFADFSIEDGKLRVGLPSGRGVISDSVISDDKYYYVEIENDKKLKINDEWQGDVSLRLEPVEDSTISLGFNENENKANFTGGLSDIFINNKPIYFINETLSSFSNVKIGPRWPEYKEKTPPVIDDTNESNTLRYPAQIGIKDMQNTEGCFKSNVYSFDRNGAKFGDVLNQPSYVLHYLTSSFWKTDYYFEFEFRTFYPEGMIFLSRNPKKGNFYLVEIRNGKVQIKIKNNKRENKGVVDMKINDGNWHHVVVTYAKKKKSLSIVVDRTSEKTVRVQKSRINRELFIGGLPDNITDLKKLAEILEINQFRGCIRSLKINKQLQSLVSNKNTKHNRIGQCFANVEQGSYFGGDAYAIYKNNFQINKILELNFEFRTTEQNGILISISAENSSPALSIELQAGAVVMTVDNGSGYVTNVTNYLSEYALCNNAWHNVTAYYTTSELTINVDNVRRSWVVPDDAEMEELEAPLYIGGLPDEAPGGTLKTRDNFKGCIRNIKVGDKLMDWIDMDELNNVRLNSCPAVA